MSAAPGGREPTAEEFRAKAEAARRASLVWRRAAPAQRAELLGKAWEALWARRAQAIRLIHEETGKPLAEAELMELAASRILVRHFLARARPVLEDEPVLTPWLLLNKRAGIRRHPHGVVGVISPWNLPFLLAFDDAFCAMLAGNAVLLKPSEWTPRTALWLEHALASTGLLPEGLLTVVTGGPGAGERTVDACDMVAFTGSSRAGRAVAARAAAALKPCLLELGGKHPMLVLADAPLERAAAAAAWGAFANMGQLCVGVERIFVARPLYEPFCAALRGRMEALRRLPEGRGELGRLIAPFQLERVQAQLADARARGARVVGGEPGPGPLEMAPALVLDAAPGMLVMGEETFGPVAAVMPVADAEEALSLADAGPWGLAASVWTRDLALGERLAGALACGVAGVNELAVHYAAPALPFGGAKQSGLGRRHGDEGLRAFTRAQSLLVHEWPADRPDPWWFPYEEGRLAWLRRLTGLLG